MILFKFHTPITGKRFFEKACVKLNFNFLISCKVRISNMVRVFFRTFTFARVAQIQLVGMLERFFFSVLFMVFPSLVKRKKM